MIYFRLSTNGAYDGDDVESHVAVDAAIFDVVVHRTLQALKLLVVYGLLGVAKKTVALMKATSATMASGQGDAGKATPSYFITHTTAPPARI